MKKIPSTNEQFVRAVGAMNRLGDLSPGPIFFPCQQESELFFGLRNDRKENSKTGRRIE